MRKLFAGTMGAITAASLIVLGSFAGPLPDAVAASDVIVEMQLMHFTPEMVEAETGSTVVFVNNDAFDYPGLSGSHRVVADNGAFDTGTVAPGARASRTFLEPFSTSFYCTIHPTIMKGTLEVTGEPVKPAVTDKTVEIVEPKSTDPDTWAYDPAALSLQVGGKVTWRNNGATTHTVTADDGSFDKSLAPGEKVTIAFPKATAIRYACAPHPWMKGTLKIGNAKLPSADRSNKPAQTNMPSGQAPPPPPPGAGPTTFNVSAVEPDATDPMGWGYAPSALTVRQKDKVVWRNEGAQPHTVTAADGSFDANLKPGETFAFTFEQTGTIGYSCKPHPWMKGTVQIIAAGAGTGPLPPPGAVPDQVEPEQDAVAKPPAEAERESNDPARMTFALASAGAIGLLAATMMLAGSLAARRAGKQPPTSGSVEPDEVVTVPEETVPEETVPEETVSEETTKQDELVGAIR